MTGKFITIEGIEGCGKSTQIIELKHGLESAGHAIEVTREPGGTAIGEAVRKVLLDPANEAICDIAELLLYTAARAQHVEQRIRPALEAGKIVLCDRFADSTTAYQGAGRGIPLDVLDALHGIATRGIWPDLTILIDMPVEAGLARSAQVHAPDRLENEPVDFHERVREGFLEIARREPGRVRIVDGTRSIDEVGEAIWQLAAQLIEET